MTAFAAGAAGLVAVAYGAQHGWWLAALPDQPDVRAQLDTTGRAALQAWMAGAGVVGVALPVAAAWRWRHSEAVRDVLVAYAGLTVAQIGLEVALTSRFFPATALLSGLTFTTLRLLQLGAALGARGTSGTLLIDPPPVRALLWAGVGMWGANAAFLVNRLTG